MRHGLGTINVFSRTISAYADNFDDFWDAVLFYLDRGFTATVPSKMLETTAKSSR
jgi:hypothetical protein